MSRSVLWMCSLQRSMLEAQQGFQFDPIFRHDSRDLALDIFAARLADFRSEQMLHQQTH